MSEQSTTTRTYGVSTTNTPWGSVQHSREIADGIVRVSTASHGGFVLSEPRMAEYNGRMTIHFSPFAGYAYFEEDADWSVVALAFPEFFSDKDLSAAVDTVRWSASPGFCPSLPDIAKNWQHVAAWLRDTKQGQDIMARLEKAGLAV